jgi:hypothetical protein
MSFGKDGYIQSVKEKLLKEAYLLQLEQEHLHNEMREVQRYE